jgi:hypothetical protein
VPTLRLACLCIFNQGMIHTPFTVGVTLINRVEAIPFNTIFLAYSNPAQLAPWLEQGQAKVVVRVDSLEQMYSHSII